MKLWKKKKKQPTRDELERIDALKRFFNRVDKELDRLDTKVNEYKFFLLVFETHAYTKEQLSHSEEFNTIQAIFDNVELLVREWNVLNYISEIVAKEYENLKEQYSEKVGVIEKKIKERKPTFIEALGNDIVIILKGMLIKLPTFIIKGAKILLESKKKDQKLLPPKKDSQD